MRLGLNFFNGICKKNRVIFGCSRLGEQAVAFLVKILRVVG